MIVLKQPKNISKVYNLKMSLKEKLKSEFNLSDEQIKWTFDKFPETVIQRAWSVGHIYHPKDMQHFKELLIFFNKK